jgi:hypothetical protein
MRHLSWLLSAFPLWAGCLVQGGPPSDGARPTCQSDEQCEGAQVCFVDGCGDPGSNLAVEIIPNARSGYHAQDFLIPELKGVQNFELYPGATLTGAIVQTSSVGSGADAGTPSPYTRPVSVRALGESALIPGLVRRFETLVTTEEARYVLPVATGFYTVVLTPADLTLPPQFQPPAPGERLRVYPGEAQEAGFTLPALSSLTAVSGVLVQVSGQLLQVPMEVQALARDTLEPLSQPAPVAPDLGTFKLWVPPAAAAQGYLIRATPRLSIGAQVPSKLFEVRAEGEGTMAELEMGAFGEPVTVSGQVVSHEGTPLAGATVYTRGVVEGGGIFRSQQVSTDTAGRFQLQALPSKSGVPSDLWVVPPPRSPSGVLRTQVNITPLMAPLESLSAPPKVQVLGEVRLPEGAGHPALDVQVLAEPLRALEGHALPAAGASATTNGAGQFRLPLEPGHYRLDILPGGSLPRVSRFITVPSELQSAPEGPQSLVLDPLRLSLGRSVVGTVRTPTRSGGSSEVAPNASLRFYRLVRVDERDSHVLLAETAADAAGNYSVVLPTRTPESP